MMFLPERNAGRIRRGWGVSDVEPSSARAEWSRVAADPDPRSDLEYRLIDLDVIVVEGSESVVFMPDESDMHGENEFVVAGESDVCDLESWA